MKRSWVEINLGQLKDNYRILKNNLPENIQVMAVVKANAYGHGDVQIARTLQVEGVKNFAVSNITEAISLRCAGIGGNILILGYTPVELADELYKYDLTQTVFSEEYADCLQASSRHRVKCHIALDTGMNRIGFDAKDTENCIEKIRRLSVKFNITGIFTHLCAADSLNKSCIDFTSAQIQLFKQITQQIEDLNIEFVHIMNSAGALYNKHIDISKFNLVRLGIVLYGLRPNPELALPRDIAPVLCWKTVVTMVKNIRQGDSVGYGRKFYADKDMRIATLSTGYADGYNRRLSNKGYVLIHGHRAPIVGNICMDQMMVDVTEIPDVKMCDEVVLIGKQGDHQITAEGLAVQTGTIGYDIVCSVGRRVDVIYINF